MIVTHHREKLIQAIVYFAQHTQHCGKTKLFKLLYLLDFEHFRQTGRNVTGLSYFAWKMGPVPVAVDEEWNEFEPDLAEAISIEPEPQFDFVRQTIIPKVEFNDSHFSKRELRLMEQISADYETQLAKDMVDVTHAENGAWEKVWNDGRGYNQRIDYLLALNNEPNQAHIEESAKEYQALLESAGAC
jgi:uncharacterized phage-associated protein